MQQLRVIPVLQSNINGICTRVDIDFCYSSSNASFLSLIAVLAIRAEFDVMDDYMTKGGRGGRTRWLIQFLKKFILRLLDKNECVIELERGGGGM